MNKNLRNALIGALLLGLGYAGYLANPDNPPITEKTIIKSGNIYKTSIGEDIDLIEIGGKDSLQLKPILKFYKWDRECSLTFELEDNVKVLSFENDVLVVSIDEYIDIKFCKGDGDEFKWIWILKQKPLSNKLRIKLEGWEDYRFLYQPPISLDNPTGERYIDHGDDGIEHFIERPENVVGSYAIYHKTLRNNKYKTGKAWHIYRPKFVDADGNWEWAELHIENGEITEIVSQKFLDNAKYPVTSNATVGSISEGASDYDWGVDHKVIACKLDATMPETGTINVVHFWIRRWNADTVTWRTNYYSDSSGTPNSKRGADPATSQWSGTSFVNRSQSITGVSESSGAQLWSACITDLGCRLAYDTDTGNLAYEDATYLGDLDMDATHGCDTAYANMQMSCYLEYTAGGNGGGGDETIPMILILGD